MLNRLTINNYALINSLDIDFPDGLIIITGETGAGKSILLGALSLLLGGKADSSVFLDDSKNCIVEAEFDDGMILRRVISPNGRSRSFINDEPVAFSQLTSLSHQLIDIHAQHQHLLLSDADFQLSVLDYFAGNKELVEEYKCSYNDFKTTSSKITELENSFQKSLSEAEYLQFQYEQLSKANLVDGELEEIEAEHQYLSNSEFIKNSVLSTVALLNPDGFSLLQSLKDGANIISKVKQYIPQLEELHRRIDSAKIELSDIEAELSSLGEKIEFSQDRLQFISDRISLIYTLFKKHNCNSVSELITIRDNFSSSLQRNDSLQEEIATLRIHLEDAKGKMEMAANKLSLSRENAAPSLSSELQHSIRELEMPMAQFKIDISKKESLSDLGQDSINFLFSANGGEKLGDLSKVASGGELSRVMLSLKALIAHFTSLPTMIFDEIDTGVSGRIADKMGNMIGDMGKNMQIFAITHLPQIASKKGAHYLVYKEMDNGSVETKIKLLTYEERVMELARMLSGSSLSKEAIENAKVLLKANN